MVNLQSLPLTLPTDTLSSTEVIETMIELKVQLAQLEHQIQALQPAFFVACAALKLEKIERERAIISKRLTPGQWNYSPDIVQQDLLLKQLRRQFQLDHDPIAGRDVIWVLKLLLKQH